MFKHVPPFAFVITTALILNPAHANVVFEDDFEAISVGSFSGNSDWTVFTDSSTVEVQEDTANLFGRGTSNRVMFLSDNHNSGKFALSTDFANQTVGTLSFEFVEPDFSGERFVIRMGDKTFDPSLDDGEITGNPIGANNDNVVNAYNIGQRYRLDIVLNQSGAAITDYTGDEDLADDRADIWLTDFAANTTTLMVDDSELRDPSKPWDRVVFQVFSDDQNDMYIDDVKVIDEASVSIIPEPASLALMGLGGLLMIGHRRRH